MPQLSLRQAASQVGVSRQTIYRLVAEGKLTATVDDQGRKVVDTAELLRVFNRLSPPETVTPRDRVLPPETPPVTSQAMTAEERRREAEIADRSALRAELAAAREALKTAQDELRDAKDEKAKLLDLLAGQTRLLEHKAEVEAPKGFWRRVFGR